MGVVLLKKKRGGFQNRVTGTRHKEGQPILSKKAHSRSHGGERVLDKLKRYRPEEKENWLKRRSG